VDGGLKIDGVLRFDGVRSLLARADDRAIEELLSPYFGEKGWFVHDPTDAWLLTQGPYFETPLRDNAVPRVAWRIHSDQSEPVFFRKERVPLGGRLVDRWMHTEMRVVPKAGNAWLALSVVDMEELCRRAEVNAEDGLQVELDRYSPNELYEYDEGFGILRAPE
jgi:hypothetical protein